MTFDLDDYPSKELGSYFVSFTNFIIDGDGVSSRKFWKVLFLDEFFLNKINECFHWIAIDQLPFRDDSDFIGCKFKTIFDLNNIHMVFNG